MTRKLTYVLMMAIALALFLWGTYRQATRVNVNMTSVDQSAYMEYSKGIAQTKFQYPGDRNRMPIYPGLMSFFYKDGMSDQDFFERGKLVGVGIGLLSLGVIYLVFRQIARPIDALTGTLVATFTVIAYKAPYFQAEVLYYAIGLVLFYLLLGLMRNPQPRSAALAGLVGGIAHLTKASVIPAIVLAALLLIGRGVFGNGGRQHDTPPSAQRRQRLRAVLQHLGYVAIFLGCFLLVVYPYIRTSKERFGQYFYNVNSTFYVWYDSWEEAKAGTRANGDRVGWPEMPEEQIPSLQKYLREHSPAQILARFTLGLREMRSRIIRSYGYAEFLMVYVIALIALTIQNKALRARLSLRHGRPFRLLLILGYFLGYTLLYAWYTPIAGGNRLILSLYLPAMLMMLGALSDAQDHDSGFDLFGVRIAASIISPAVLLFLAAYVLVVYPLRISSMFGGG